MIVKSQPTASNLYPFHEKTLVWDTRIGKTQGSSLDVPRAQRTPIGNPYISPKNSGYLWVRYPQESQGFSHNFHTVWVHVRERGPTPIPKPRLRRV